MAIVAAEHWNWSKFVRKDDTGATALEVLTSKDSNFQDCRPRLDFLNSKISFKQFGLFLNSFTVPTSKIYTSGP